MWLGNEQDQVAEGIHFPHPLIRSEIHTSLQTDVSDEDVAHNIIHIDGRQTRINRPLSHPPNEGSQMDEEIIQMELRIHGGVEHFFNPFWHPLAAMPFLAPHIITPTEQASGKHVLQTDCEWNDLQRAREGSGRECISANKWRTAWRLCRCNLYSVRCALTT